MNQNTIYIAIGIVALLILGLWGLNARKADAPIDDVATTTDEMVSVDTQVQGGVQKATPAPRAPGVLVNGDYTLSVEDSVIGWTGRKPRVLGYEDTGTLTLQSGALTVSNGHIETGSFVIDMTTLSADSTTNKKATVDMLEGHLKSDDFFAVETYPTASFVIKNVTNSVVTGELTIKGIAKTISFPATITQNGTELTAQASITLNRSEWDIRYGSGSFFDNLGDNLIADEVSITLELVAVQ